MMELTGSVGLTLTGNHLAGGERAGYRVDGEVIDSFHDSACSKNYNTILAYTCKSIHWFIIYDSEVWLNIDWCSVAQYSTGL